MRHGVSDPRHAHGMGGPWTLTLLLGLVAKDQHVQLGVRLKCTVRDLHVRNQLVLYVISHLLMHFLSLCCDIFQIAA